MAPKLHLNLSIDSTMDHSSTAYKILDNGSHSNSSEESPFNQLNDDIFVVVGWTAMAIFGFVTNVLILVGILHTKKLYQSTSYWLIISLSICDMAMIVICLCHLAPATVLHERYVTLIDFSNAFGIFLYDSFWYIGVLHLMVMSINRYVSICQPTHYLNLFSRQKTAIMIGLLYPMGIIVAIPGLFSCCYLVFNTDFYAAQYEPPDTSYRFVDMAINGSSLVVMTFCYTCIIIRVRRSRVMLHQYRKLYKEQRTLQSKAALVYAASSKNKDNITSKFARLFKPNVPIISRREVRLFFQFFTVSVIFFASVTTWGWLPQLSESKWVGFAVTSLFFLNNSTNPTVYLIFNNILRRQIQKVICPFKATSAKAKKHKRKTVRDGISAAAAAGIWASDTRPTQFNRGGSLLQKFRQSTHQKRDSSDFENSEYLDFGRGNARRSTAFDEDEGRLIREFESRDNDLTDNPDPDVPASNATCNLMAMAAFLNTSTVAGRVLMKTVDDEKADKLSKLEQVGKRMGPRMSLVDIQGRKISNALRLGKRESVIIEDPVALDGKTDGKLSN